MIEALRSFDEAFARLTLPEKREFLGLMLKKVVIYADQIVVELYEGRQAARLIRGLTRRGGKGSRGGGSESGEGDEGVAVRRDRISQVQRVGLRVDGVMPVNEVAWVVEGWQAGRALRARMALIWKVNLRLMGFHLISS